MNLMLEHKRLHERLLAYWQAARGNRPFPSEKDIDPEELADVWDACFLLQVTPAGFSYAYLGESLVKAYGDDLTSRDVCSTLVEPKSASMAQKCAEVVKQKTQMIDESEFVNTLGMRVKYRSCLLPLGDRADEVNYILGAMRWKTC
jgi:hypothetical protein